MRSLKLSSRASCDPATFSAVVQSAEALPEGDYLVGSSLLLVTEAIREVARPYLPTGFDPEPGARGRAVIVAGRLWWSLWGCRYPAEVVLAVTSSHPGVTWLPGRDHPESGTPAIGVLRGRVVALVAEDHSLRETAENSLIDAENKKRHAWMSAEIKEALRESRNHSNGDALPRKEPA